MRYSVIIPTCGQLDECLKPCIESIIKYTDILKKDIEIIVIANGCNSNEIQYIRNLKLLYNDYVIIKEYSEKIGYTLAINKGIQTSTGEYIILLNDDIVLLEQSKNDWIRILEEPFLKSTTVGATGIHKLDFSFDSNNKFSFLLFFCVMIKRSVFDQVGLLDERFNPGYGEDIDFCYRLIKYGYSLKLVDDMKFDPQHNFYVGSYPLYHRAESTVHKLENWDEIKDRNIKYIRKKYKKVKYSIIIPTYNHLELLKTCVSSLLQYTNLEDKEIIIVANGCGGDTEKYITDLKNDNIKYLKYNNPLGFAGAVNKGVVFSNGSRIVLLNDDCILLPQKCNEWINILEEPFIEDKNVGITGVHENYCKYTNQTFLLFHCVMINKEMFDKVGLLDEIFNPGSGEDTDFCMKVKDAGYDIACVTDDIILDDKSGSAVGNFPLYHRGHGTLGDIPNLENIIDRNSCILKDRYSSSLYKDISLVIVTCDYLLFEKCFNSIIEHTPNRDLKNLQIVVVANGTNCCNQIHRYVIDVNTEYDINVIVYPIDCGDALLPYSQAINIGIKQANREYVILMNDDVILLNQKSGSWVDLLKKPFLTNDKLGITGPSYTFMNFLNKGFIEFFLCMIRNSVFKDVGYIDEEYGNFHSYCDDIDFNYRTQLQGYEIECVPDKETLVWDPINGIKSSDFPVYHKGGSTTGRSYKDVLLGVNRLINKFVEDKSQLKELLYKDNINYNDVVQCCKGENIVMRDTTVTAVINTKGRYYSTLPLTIQSVLNQSRLPERLIIYDDTTGDTKIDPRDLSIYKKLFSLLDKKGINWNYIYTNGVGQVRNHQDSLYNSKTKYIWRLDDDTIAEKEVLYLLLKNMKDNVGAVGGSVIDPETNYLKPHPLASNNIKHIYRGMNKQWYLYENKQVMEVDHLYSSFLYDAEKGRKSGGYNLNLSTVGHREETMFTYNMKKNGYEILFDPKIITWHYRESTGGIRSQGDDFGIKSFQNDERVFSEYLSSNNIKTIPLKICVLDNGLGDHFSFKHILDELKEKYKDHDIVIGVCYEDAFFDEPNITLMSIEQSKNILGDIYPYNIYSWCVKHNWNESLVEAFRKMYIENIY